MVNRGVKRVLIVGAGIGGLAAAVLLSRRAVEVVCVEINPSHRGKGIGLGIAANGLRALKLVGVLDDFVDSGYIIRDISFYDALGNRLGVHRFALGDSDYPPFCAAPRASLHSLLVRAADEVGVSMRLGRTVDQIHHAGTHESVVFDDGTVEQFDVVVGFDGIRSVVRRLMFGNTYDPIDSGYGVWRVKVPREPEVTGMHNYLSVRNKVAFLPIGVDTMYLAHIRPAGEMYRADSGQYARELRAGTTAFRGLPGRVLGKLSEHDEVIFGSLEVSRIPPMWFRGRVVLAGDAVHAAPPHLTQGASMALEDAVVLSDELTTGDSIEISLARYMDRRLERCLYVRAMSLRLLEKEMRTDPEISPTTMRASIVGRWLAEQPLADTLLNELVL